MFLFLTGVAECYYNAGGGPFIRVTATNAVGLTVYVIGCTDTNPVATDPETVDTSCPITPVSNYGRCCLFGFNVAFNNVSVISRRCLVATGSSMLTVIVLPH